MKFAKEFTTGTGAEVKIGICSSEEAFELHNAIAMEMSDMNPDVDAASIESSVMRGVMMAIASKRVQKALFDCLKRCLRNDQPITKDTFEDVEARKDYYSIVMACVEVNIVPFIQGVPQAFAALSSLQSIANDLKQK